MFVPPGVSCLLLLPHDVLVASVLLFVFTIVGSLLVQTVVFVSVDSLVSS